MGVGVGVGVGEGVGECRVGSGVAAGKIWEFVGPTVGVKDGGASTAE